MYFVFEEEPFLEVRPAFCVACSFRGFINMWDLRTAARINHFQASKYRVYSMDAVGENMVPLLDHTSHFLQTP